jgi:hypothetical protein
MEAIHSRIGHLGIPVNSKAKKTWFSPAQRDLRWTRLEINGIGGIDRELFWSTGVLECWKKLKPEFQLE